MAGIETNGLVTEEYMFIIKQVFLRHFGFMPDPWIYETEIEFWALHRQMQWLFLCYDYPLLQKKAESIKYFSTIIGLERLSDQNRHTVVADYTLTYADEWLECKNRRQWEIPFSVKRECAIYQSFTLQLHG